MTKDEEVLLNKAMGERIREIRTGKGLEVKAVAALAGIGQFGWSRIEGGAINITYATWISICAAIDVTPREFMDFGYLGTLTNIRNNEPAQLEAEGRLAFFRELGAKGTISRALNDELEEVLRLKIFGREEVKREVEEIGDQFLFAFSGSMVITKLSDKGPVPTGYLLPRQFFFDVELFSGIEKDQFRLRPLSEMAGFYVPGELILGMMARHKTFRQLLKKIGQDVIDMERARTQFLELPRKDRITAVFERFPLWYGQFPNRSMSRYLDMGSAFYLRLKEYNEWVWKVRRVNLER